MVKLIKLIIRKFWTILALRDCKSSGKRIYINKKSKFNNKTVLGSNIHINGLRVYGDGKVTIGNNFHCGNGTKILTSNHNYNSEKDIPYDDTYVNKDVKIGNNVWIGIDVLILGGVSIGEGAIVQAGSVVSCNVNPMEIVGGNPARKFKSRDINLYKIAKKNHEEMINYNKK